MRKILLILILFLCLVCPKKEDESKIIASVDNIKLTADDLKMLYPETFIYQLSTNDLEKLLEDWVNTEVLYLEAKNQKIDQEDSIKFHLDLLKKSTLAQTLIMREVEKVRVTQEEAQDYFNKYKKDFLYAVKFYRIVAPTMIAAQEIMAEIDSGANFKRLAEARSPQKIELRYWQRQDLPPRFGEKIFQLKKGEITGIIKEDISRNFLIGQLVDKRKMKSNISFSEVSDYIYNLLRFYKQTALYDTLTTNLKSKHTIKLHPERLR